MVNIYLRLKYGSFVIILLQLLAVWLSETSAVDENCSFNQQMTPGVTYYVYNPGYPNDYTPSENCRWTATAPNAYRINITCQIEMPASAGCNQNRLLISLSGNLDLQNSHTYCGNGNISLQTESNNISIGLITPYKTLGGKFLCSLQTEEVLKSTCDCGQKQSYRIVGGVETKVNEYPMMAALMNYEIQDQFCGATIIATRYTISAAHCFRRMTTSIVGLLVGDHDITTADDTNTARLYDIEQFIIHPDFIFDDVNAGYDIAIVKTVLNIEFGEAVGPACLPLRYYEESFAGQSVEVLGWGTSAYTGSKSNVLLKTNLTVLSIEDCYNSTGNTPQHMCTYEKDQGSCQFDSGGPLLWHNDEHERLYLIATVSSGVDCASSIPAINMRITSFMPWIIANTIDADYCVK